MNGKVHGGDGGQQRDGHEQHEQRSDAEETGDGASVHEFGSPLNSSTLQSTAYYPSPARDGWSRDTLQGTPT